MQLAESEKSEKYKFAYIEGRFDELLKNSFDNKASFALWVIDGENGTAHHWEKLGYPNNQTIIDWLENKEYLNSKL